MNNIKNIIPIFATPIFWGSFLILGEFLNGEPGATAAVLVAPGWWLILGIFVLNNLTVIFLLNKVKK